MKILLHPRFGSGVELCLGSVGDELIFGVLFVVAAVHLIFEPELVDYVIRVLIGLILQQSDFHPRRISAQFVWGCELDGVIGEDEAIVCQASAAFLLLLGLGFPPLDLIFASLATLIEIVTLVDNARALGQTVSNVGGVLKLVVS